MLYQPLGTEVSSDMGEARFEWEEKWERQEQLAKLAHRWEWRSFQEAMGSCTLQAVITAT